VVHNVSSDPICVGLGTAVHAPALGGRDRSKGREASRDTSAARMSARTHPTDIALKPILC
jgi:hypothetical protein